MGDKSTRELTRAEAEERYVRLMFKASEGDRTRRYRAHAALMGNKDLEGILEELNDLAHDGEGFENYLVVS